MSAVTLNLSIDSTLTKLLFMFVNFEGIKGRHNDFLKS